MDDPHPKHAYKARAYKEKKKCILDASVVFKVLLYELFTVRLSQSFSFDHDPI